MVVYAAPSAPFTDAALRDVCRHLNTRTRCAKLAGYDSTAMFLALFFRSRAVCCPARPRTQAHRPG